jgi:hypothetical protein
MVVINNVTVMDTDILYLFVDFSSENSYIHITELCNIKLQIFMGAKLSWGEVGATICLQIYI